MSGLIESSGVAHHLSDGGWPAAINGDQLSALQFLAWPLTELKKQTDTVVLQRNTNERSPAMKSTVTVRLDEDLDRLLPETSEHLGRSRSDIVRDALRRRLSMMTFDKLREQVMSFAEARGYLTDDDVFREIS